MSVSRAWAVALLTAALLAVSQAAWAQISVSPMRTTLRVKAGGRQTGSFKIENRDTQPVLVTVEAEDWREGARGGRGPVSWLTLRPSRFHLEPGKMRVVTYQVRVPRQANGELAAQLFFSTSAKQHGPVSVLARLGAVLYVAIEGTEHVDMEIAGLRCFYTASTPGIKQPDRLEVVTSLKNGGTVHLVPHGEALVHNSAGRLLYRIPLQSGWGLLPSEQDVYRAILHGALLGPGRYAISSLMYAGEEVGKPVVMERCVEIQVEPDGRMRIVPTR